MSTTHIRPARPEDLQRVNEILVAGDVEHASAMPRVFNDRETRQRAEEILSRLEDDRAAVYVAETDDLVVGVIHLEIQTEEGSPGELARDFGWVLTLDVDRKYRRRGIGRMLMEAGERWARSMGVDHMEFMVWDFNRSAIQFYSSLGYEVMNLTMTKRL